MMEILPRFFQQLFVLFDNVIFLRIKVYNATVMARSCCQPLSFREILSSATFSTFSEIGSIQQQPDTFLEFRQQLTALLRVLRLNPTNLVPSFSDFIDVLRAKYPAHVKRLETQNLFDLRREFVDDRNCGRFRHLVVIFGIVFGFYEELYFFLCKKSAGASSFRVFFVRYRFVLAGNVILRRAAELAEVAIAWTRFRVGFL